MGSIFTKRMTSIAVVLALGAPAWAGEVGMTEAVVNHHLAAFGNADMDAMLSDYTEASVLIANGTVMTGPEEMRPLFEALFAEFGQPDVTFEMTNMQFNGRIGYLIWTAETPDNIYEMGTDTFLVEDGKIVVQTLATKTTAK